MEPGTLGNIRLAWYIKARWRADERLAFHKLNSCSIINSRYNLDNDTHGEILFSRFLAVIYLMMERA